MAVQPCMEWTPLKKQTSTGCPEKSISNLKFSCSKKRMTHFQTKLSRLQKYLFSSFGNVYLLNIKSFNYILISTYCPYLVTFILDIVIFKAR